MNASPTHPKRTATPAAGGGRSGQAMVEMIVGLVALLVVFAGIVQLSILGFEQSLTLLNARAKAGQYALADVYSVETPGPRFIQDWDAGDDTSRHSVDDVATAADPTMAARILTDPSHPNRLNGYLPDNEISQLANSSLLAGFDLVTARERSDTILLLPAVRHLLYDSDSIRLEADACLSWTKGIR